MEVSMSNDTTLGDFIKHFNQHDTNKLMSTFCQDDTGSSPNAPCVGITDHGPAFILSTDVQSLFNQLFTTFHKLTWTPLQAPSLSWSGSLGSVTGEIAVQFTLTGQYVNDWFQSTHASPPLSNLHNYQNGQSLGRRRKDNTGLPGAAFFSFDASSKIRQLQIYIDRYALMQSITQTAGDWDASGGN
jgi:hypothetical protein